MEHTLSNLELDFPREPAPGKETGAGSHRSSTADTAQKPDPRSQYYKDIPQEKRAGVKPLERKKVERIQVRW